MTRCWTALVSASVLALATSACTRNDLLDFAMTSAPRAGRAGTSPPRVQDRLLLAGDLHCHVLPPDAPHHVARGLPATLDLAVREGLDFVVLTPHVPARFYADPPMRAWVVRTQHTLRRALAEETARRSGPVPIVIPGFEYTDGRYGHVGAGFADLDAVLADLDRDGVDDDAEPERFFERWVAHGGVLTINHPVQRPLRGAPVMALRYDMSWRAFHGAAVPREIAWITAHAQTVETFNASIAHLRDHSLLVDGDRSLREATHLLDVATRRDGRPRAAVGGSDSHGAWLRPTTWVLARERTSTAVREAIVEGRTCVRGPDACTLEVRASGDARTPWRMVGDELPAGLDAVEARGGGRDATTFVVNGERVARAAPGEIVRLAVPRDRCTLVRAITGVSWSSPVRVGCASR